jgi:hypothetical protein
MAIYDGSPFEAGIGPGADDIVLFAACPPPEVLGFEPATGHWRKQVRFSDVQAVWESRPVGVFRGERCLVLDDLGDRLHIGYLGHDGITADQLGYWQVDRGVFELIAPRSEVTAIAEERIDVARPATGAPAGQPSGTSTSPGFTAVAPLAPPETGYRPVPDDRTGVTLPPPAAAPLPLEAEAMRAATDAAGLPSSITSRFLARAAPSLAPDLVDDSPSRHDRPARRRMDTEELFAELAELAGIPPDSYAVGEEVEGALCLMESESGFEVFFAAEGARHELQAFETEEAACFYLFGVLAAESVRAGTLARVPDPVASWESQPA